jgi:hypothetical protein
MSGQATWIEKGQLERLGSALGEGRATDIDRLLAEILAGGEREGSAPTACAVCRRELVRCGFGQPGLVASTCPVGHGAWMGLDALEALRQAIDGYAASIRARRRIMVLCGALAISVAALGASVLLPGNSITRRPTGPRPIPADEQRYFGQLIAVLEDGASNRRNIEGVLKAGDSELDTYRAVFDIYRGRAEDVIARLRRLDTPERLQPAHDRIVRAAERQIVFYGDFTTARIKGQATDLARMLGHPAAREASHELHTAWDLVRRLYPDQSPAQLDPIEQRFCRFDLQ